MGASLARRKGDVRALPPPQHRTPDWTTGMKAKWRNEAGKRRINQAAQEGHGPVTDRRYGRSLGAKFDQVLSPKASVDACWIPYWKAKKKVRKDNAERPMDSINPQIKRLWKQIYERTNLESLGHIENGFGNGDPAELLSGPNSSWEPYSGLAWYVAEIERIYENCRTQIELGESGRAAHHAFRLGMLFQEFQHMESAGEFFDKAVAVKRAQQNAGSSTMRVSVEQRQATYKKYRDAGVRKTAAAESAANDLLVSPSTIRNAFGGRLP